MTIGGTLTVLTLIFPTRQDSLMQSMHRNFYKFQLYIIMHVFSYYSAKYKVFYFNIVLKRSYQQPVYYVCILYKIHIICTHITYYNYLPILSFYLCFQPSAMLSGVHLISLGLFRDKWHSAEYMNITNIETVQTNISSARPDRQPWSV